MMLFDIQQLACHLLQRQHIVCAGAGAIMSVGLMRKVALQQIKDMWQQGVRVSGGELVHSSLGFILHGRGRSADVEGTSCRARKGHMAQLPCSNECR